MALPYSHGPPQPPYYTGSTGERMASMRRAQEDGLAEVYGADEAAVALRGGLGSGGSSTTLHGYVPGQQVESTRDLVARDDVGEPVVAASAGCRGVVLGPAASGDPRRLAVLFDEHCGEPLNVLPHEVRVGAEPFDAQSRSIEVHLARLLWDGRDPLSNPAPPRVDAMHEQDQIEVLQGAAAATGLTVAGGGGGAGGASAVVPGTGGFVYQLPPHETALRERGTLPCGPMSLSVVNQKPRPQPIDPRHRARLLNFFERYNPHRLPSVPDLLQEHAGREELLLQTLVRKYGPEPMEGPAMLPSGWTQVQSSKGHIFYRHANGSKQWTRPV